MHTYIHTNTLIDPHPLKYTYIHIYIHTYIHTLLSSYFVSLHESIFSAVIHTYIHTYIHTHQVILNYIGKGMPLLQAVVQPRIHTQLFPDMVKALYARMYVCMYVL